MGEIPAFILRHFKDVRLLLMVYAVALAYRSDHGQWPASLRIGPGHGKRLFRPGVDFAVLRFDRADPGGVTTLALDTTLAPADIIADA